VELPARGVEATLLVFPAVVEQRSTVLVDYIADECFGGCLSQRRGFVHVADDLSAELPHIIDMVLGGSFGKPGLGQVNEKRHEVCDEFAADREIFFLAHPTLRPLPKIAAIAAVGQ
jgi:hypothetical protein